MIRVLIVDDSPTVRAAIRMILRADPQVHVMAEADNGRDAVRLARELRPDLITMDILMPGMNGLEATGEIMAEAPTRIIIVSGNENVHTVAGSLHALRLGALCVMPTPCGPQHPRFAPERDDLLRAVRTMSTVNVVRHWRPRREGEPAPRPGAGTRRGRERIDLVAIASSTGGPAALQRILAALPPDFGLPILIVQHMPTGFMQGLAEWLGSCCPLRVSVATSEDPLEPGRVYLAPEDRHLGVTPDADRVLLSTAPPVGGFRPSATFLFESAARAMGPAVLGVVLTGMGRDGVDGLRSMHAAGGRIVAQDEATSIVYGMPREAAAERLPDVILPLDAIRWELMEAARHDHAS